MRRRTAVACALSILLAAAAQHALGARLAVWGARPDLPLLLLAGWSLILHRRSAAVYGFFAGLVDGALAVSGMGASIASRAIAGFAAAWSRNLGFEAGWLAAAGTTVATTLLAEFLWMFFAAPRHVAGFVADTIRTATYNGVLAIPLYALLNRIGRGGNRFG